MFVWLAVFEQGNIILEHKPYFSFFPIFILYSSRAKKHVHKILRDSFKGRIKA